MPVPEVPMSVFPSSWRPILALAALSCAPAATIGCTPQAQMADLMRDSWRIVREYERDGYTYFVVQEGPRFAKIVQLPSGPVYTLYEVDTMTRCCKWGEAIIECAALRADPDLGPLVSSAAPLPLPMPPVVQALPSPPPPLPSEQPQPAPAPPPSPPASASSALPAGVPF